MQVNPLRPINSSSFKLTTLIPNISPTDFNTTRINTIDPTVSVHGHVAQLINNKFIRETKKNTKRVVMGRKLKEFLEGDYSPEEILKMPISLRNLLRFSHEFSTAEIIKFLEYVDSSHEITFKDFSFDRMKFKVLFEALGELRDVEMQAGENSFVSLSNNFELKEKIFSVFEKIKSNFSIQRA